MAVEEGHVILVIRRNNMSIFNVGLLIVATCCHFITGVKIFMDVKMSAIAFSSLMLVLAGLISGHVVFTSAYSLLMIFMAAIIHWLSKKKRIKKVNGMGIMYVNLSSLPTIVYLAQWIGS